MATTAAQKKATPQKNYQSDIDRVFELQMQHRFAVAQTTRKERIAKLKRLLEMVERRKEDLYKAMYADFKKPRAEVDLSEILHVNTEIKHAIKHLKQWMKPQKVKPTLAMMTTRSYVQYEPKGVILIISPWNYPFNLTFGPLASAIAAGNCAILKPSEHVPHTSALIKEMVETLFPEKEVAIFEGDKTVSQALLAKPFHHIFFTGSPAVGKIVMKAAAEHLTSVTLELGGKSPVIIDETADAKDAAEKIMWGKFANCGQTCITADYIYVHQKKYPAFLEASKQMLIKYYGESEEAREQSPHLARVAHSTHHKRLTEMLKDAVDKGANVEFGGKSNPADNYISPTLLSKVSPQSLIMQDEIFGPILPIFTYQNMDQVFADIQSGEKPLALYIFSRNKKNIKKVFANTSAGGTGINDILTHYLHPHLPFGGVNNSGFGKSHGVYGFKAFSNERAVLKQVKHSPLKLLAPPYNNRVQKLIDIIVKYLA